MKVVNLTAEEEKDLAERRDRGDRKAVDRLVLCNMGLVYHVSKRFRVRDREDLIQAGMLGLVMAANHFDANHGTRFTTFAAACIRRSMVDLLLETHGQITAAKGENGRKTFCGLESAMRKLGPSASTAALASEIGVSEAMVEAVVPRRFCSDRSMDAMYTSDGETRRFGDDIACPDPSPEELYAESEEHDHRLEVVREGLGQLGERNAAVVIGHRMRGESCSKLAKEHGFTRQRGGQVLNRAEKRLKVICRRIEARRVAKGA